MHPTSVREEKRSLPLHRLKVGLVLTTWQIRREVWKSSIWIHESGIIMSTSATTGLTVFLLIKWTCSRFFVSLLADILEFRWNSAGLFLLCCRTLSVDFSKGLWGSNKSERFPPFLCNFQCTSSRAHSQAVITALGSTGGDVGRRRGDLCCCDHRRMRRLRCSWRSPTVCSHHPWLRLSVSLWLPQSFCLKREIREEIATYNYNSNKQIILWKQQIKSVVDRSTSSHLMATPLTSPVWPVPQHVSCSCNNDKTSTSLIYSTAAYCIYTNILYTQNCVVLCYTDRLWWQYFKICFSI